MTTGREGQHKNQGSHKLQTRLHEPGAKHVCWYRRCVCVCFRPPKMRWNVALTCVLVSLSLADCGSRAESSEWSWGKGRDRSTDGKATGKWQKTLLTLNDKKPYWLQTTKPSLKRRYSLILSTNSPHFLVTEGSLPYTQQPLGNILSLVSPIHNLKPSHFKIHFNDVLN
jgi:hypothetical protein